MGAFSSVRPWSPNWTCPSPSVHASSPRARAKARRTGALRCATCLTSWPHSPSAGSPVGELLPLSWSYIVTATRQSGDACVLKIDCPVDDDGEGAAHKALTLRLAGPSAVRLLRRGRRERGVAPRTGDGRTAGRCMRRSTTTAPRNPSPPPSTGFRHRRKPTAASTLGRLEAPSAIRSSPTPCKLSRKDLAETLAEIDSDLRDLRAAVVTARRVLQELLANRAPTSSWSTATSITTTSFRTRSGVGLWSIRRASPVTPATTPAPCSQPLRLHHHVPRRRAARAASARPHVGHGRHRRRPRGGLGLRQVRPLTVVEPRGRGAGAR